MNAQRGDHAMRRSRFLWLAVVLGAGIGLAATMSRGGWAQPAVPAETRDDAARRLFARDNLVAWCIVPFDSKRRGPEDRAAMLERLGFKHFAYDWRAEHIPSFDAELDALARHKVALDAFWVAPGELNRESRIILDVLKRHQVKAQLWVLLDLGGDRVSGPEQARRVESAANKLRPLADEAAKIGCSLALYNHGGWFGEPENQIAIIEHLKKQGVANVGMVYNLHHGHDHLDRFKKLLPQMMPYLWVLNLNGMDRDGDRLGRKILPLGQGALDLELLRTIVDSGYRGRIGILGHTMDDAEERLRDNLDGLDWLMPPLAGYPAAPRPKPRTPVPPPPAASPAPATSSSASPTGVPAFDPAIVTALVEAAQARGDAARGAALFSSPSLACLSCHRVGDQGGTVGPDLTTLGICTKPAEIAESVLWPRRAVKDEYRAITVVTSDGKVRQGYAQADTGKLLALRELVTGATISIPRAEIEEVRQDGTLMPEGLLAAISHEDRRDLIRFLLDLGRPTDNSAARLAAHGHVPPDFPYVRDPLVPERWPSWRLPVNRDRVYDWYTKEADYFARQKTAPLLLPQFPGLDGGRLGHWGNQNEDSWADDRWNRTDLGTVQSGVFRGAGVTVAKGVCVRLGDQGELSVCFNPQTLCYEALWMGGFLRFSATRHGFLDGLIMEGKALPRPEGQKPAQPFVYHGFYRHGRRVIFAYRIGDRELLDAPWVENGSFTRVVAPVGQHPLRDLIRGGPAQWPRVITTRGKLGTPIGGWPYVVDTIEPPFQNPWNALMFFGDHDFFPDGAAMVCTIQGDVWRVTGIDGTLNQVKWKRFATGLHQALGLRIADGSVYVLGRDQITRLRDLDGDGEADFYECFSNCFETSPAGHDFICGLERDPSGRFFTVSGRQGLLQISADGRSAVTLATGFRNPDGLGLGPEGTLTVPSSEGDWVPASLVAEIRPGGHYGYGGPKGTAPPELPLVYLPRGLDNSSAGQAWVPDARFGPLEGQLLHFSFGTGSHFLVLRDKVDGQPQGAVVPLPGEFLSGAHRGRFNPADGQLYVSGTAGWGTYTPADGCFQRVRYTGGPAQIPVAFHAHENGVTIAFSLPIDPATAAAADHQFAQAWNYRYSSGYGSSELSARHAGQVGHDRLAIRSAHVLADRKTLFLEIPELQPVNQLHLHLKTNGQDPAIDMFATVNRLAPAFSGFPGFQPAKKTIAAHPIQADMVALTRKKVPNPWQEDLVGARKIRIEAGKNLSFSVRSFRVAPREAIRLTFVNPDVVPHNFALAVPGSLARVGDLVNRMIAEPDAVARHYIPRGGDILAYTDIVPPGEQFVIQFRAPAEAGRYPYLCTFPGHWMVMNGEMVVESPR